MQVSLTHVPKTETHFLQICSQNNLNTHWNITGFCVTEKTIYAFLSNVIREVKHSWLLFIDISVNYTQRPLWILPQKKLHNVIISARFKLMNIFSLRFNFVKSLFKWTPLSLLILLAKYRNLMFITVRRLCSSRLEASLTPISFNFQFVLPILVSDHIFVTLPQKVSINILGVSPKFEASATLINLSCLFRVCCSRNCSLLRKRWRLLVGVPLRGY